MEVWVPDEIENIISNLSYSKDSIGMSSSDVYMFDDYVLKIQEANEEIENEIKVSRWLQDKLNVPNIIHYEVVDEKAYVLMTRMKGKMLCDDYYLEHLDELLAKMKEALNLLQNVSINGCPCDNRVQERLMIARHYYEIGRLRINYSDIIQMYGFKSAIEVLEWLESNIPDEDLVLSHGDLCLPNIFVLDIGEIGFIDLGRTGVSDYYNDIAIAYRSVLHNLDGSYGYINDNYKPEMYFEELGISKDEFKLKYYLLLDELEWD